MSMGNLPDLTQTGLVEKNTKISYYQKNQIILKQYARRHLRFLNQQVKELHMERSQDLSQASSGP